MNYSITILKMELMRISQFGTGSLGEKVNNKESLEKELKEAIKILKNSLKS